MDINLAKRKLKRLRNKKIKLEQQKNRIKKGEI